MVGWNDSEAARFLKAESTGRRMGVRLARKDVPTWMSFDSRTVALVQTALGDALAMRRAGRALARHDDGGKKRNRRLA